MSDFTLETKIMNLPEEYKQEVSDFVDFLASKQKAVPRKSFYGALKGQLVYMASDFDAPLQDFAGNNDKKKSRKTVVQIHTCRAFPDMP